MMSYANLDLYYPERELSHLHLLNNPLLPTDLKCSNDMFTEYFKNFFIYLAVPYLVVYEI